MNEIKIAAFRISAAGEGTRYPLPKEFLTHLGVKNSQNMAETWMPKMEMNITSKNIQDAKWHSNAINASPVWSAIFLEARPEKNIELMNMLNGNKSSLELDKDQSTKYQEWNFCIFPDKNLLILELKGRGIEKKLESFLAIHIYEWSKSFPQNQFDNIHIDAIPREHEPIGYLKSRPELAAISFRIKSKSIDTKYGIFGGLFSNLSEDDKDYLVFNVEISSSKRGGNLPDISLTTAADILESLEREGNDSLLQASVKPTADGKRYRAMHLLNAITEKSVFLKTDENIINHMCQFAREIDLGTGLELSDE